MIIKYDSRPFEYSERPKFVPIEVKTSDPIVIAHGCLHVPVFAYIVRSDCETVMTVQCMNQKQAIVTFSHYPANVIIRFD